MNHLTLADLGSGLSAYPEKTPEAMTPAELSVFKKRCKIALELVGLKAVFDRAKKARDAAYEAVKRGYQERLDRKSRDKLMADRDRADDEYWKARSPLYHKTLEWMDVDAVGGWGALFGTAPTERDIRRTLQMCPRLLLMAKPKLKATPAITPPPSLHPGYPMPLGFPSPVVAPPEPLPLVPGPVVRVVAPYPEPGMTFVMPYRSSSPLR